MILLALSAATLLAATAVPAPALLVGHLRVADIACLEAASRLPSDGGYPTPDGSPRWAGDLLDRAASNLSGAKLTTVDPMEQVRLDALASEALSVKRSLKTRAEGASLRVTRLRSEIRRFANEVQRRIDLRQADPVPLTRPRLEP